MFNLYSHDAKYLCGKRIGMFSYGSGLASSMFSLRMTSDQSQLEPALVHLEDVLPRLERRARIAAQDFVDILASNEQTHHTGIVLLFSLVASSPMTSHIYLIFRRKMNAEAKFPISPVIFVVIDLAPFKPIGSVDSLHPGSYYLVAVDAMYRRSYARRPLDGAQGEQLTNGHS